MEPSNGFSYFLCVVLVLSRLNFAALGRGPGFEAIQIP